ncbi:zinc-ribbons [Izhakiella capsodis]|uniref:Zinc-ribbons n=1 Tax=Izhakiella capsodis TaxID=1367852 RepID=A0A1I4WG37_9GAMM|nr:zinc-ribbon domain-containing protein [Izhakiella capsodis]SFN12232.1 zinc-ribbons [Izhakiella capsodis]
MPLCPHDKQRLNESASGFDCPACGRQFGNQPVCPECVQPAEVLKACGAVDFFCKTHGMISLSRVIVS